ncbi:MAG: alanine dehydrogenase [Deltaproteobacteria bacterium]|nr:alanine dehydrogenase [Deltaproteobacteria bacterium]
MVIGIPKEIKEDEYRVSVVPSGVKALVDAGHDVLVEKDAGSGSSITDEEYIKAGAVIVESAQDVWRKAALIVKVKEPRPQEYGSFRRGLTIFTFFHLASNPTLTEELIKKAVTAVAYETIETNDKRLPLLTPMSEIAGRLSVQAGAYYLLKPCGGRGILVSGAPGVERAKVIILGAGTVGSNAARVATGMGADVTLMDINAERLRTIEDTYGNRVNTLFSNTLNIERAVAEGDLIIGATHIPGARTPRLVSREMLSIMKKGSVIVDVSVDQGGCVETIRPTTHSNPTYKVDGIVHYGVANMPGAVPVTSTFALANATIPYALKLAGSGLKEAVSTDETLARGVNIHMGKITHESLASSLKMEFTSLASLF